MNMFLIFFIHYYLQTKLNKYFVDWDKIKKVLDRYLDEISLLNSLTKVSPSQQEKHFKLLLNKYPKIVEVIPLLIAERIKNGKINIFDPYLEQFLTFEFISSKVNEKTISKIIEFCKKTGIMDLFLKIKDIYDYLLGVEVGMDTNARKNRSGYIFEIMFQKKIKKLLKDKYKIVNNDPNFSLYPKITKGKHNSKTHDIVIYKKNKPILVVECNFYNVAGSKPISIAESYIEMHKVAKENKIDFLWVTDGPAWLKMKEALLRSMKEMEWIFNYKMLNFVEKLLKS